MPTPEQRLEAAVHMLLAEFARDGVTVDAQIVRSGASDESHIRITIFANRHDGPAKLHLTEEGHRVLGIPIPEPFPVFRKNGNSEQTPPLKEIESCILEAATSTPVSMRALLRTAGYGYHQHSRAAVAGLVERGLLMKCRLGYRAACPATHPEH